MACGPIQVFAAAKWIISELIQEQSGRGPHLRYCHVSASYCSSALPLGNVPENERVLERDRQLVAGRSMHSTVYTGKTSSCPFSSRPSLSRTVKIVGRPAKGFTAAVPFGGGGGSRMGAQPSVFTVNSPLSAVRFTTGKSVQFPM